MNNTNIVLIISLLTVAIIILFCKSKETYKSVKFGTYKNNPYINTYCFKSNDCPNGMCCVDDNKYDNPTCQPCPEECRFYPSPSNTLCVKGTGPKNVFIV